MNIVIEKRGKKNLMYCFTFVVKNKRDSIISHASLRKKLFYCSSLNNGIKL